MNKLKTATNNLEGLAAFIRKPVREEIIPSEKYRVVASVELSDNKFEHFKDTMLNDHDFIAEHSDKLFLDEDNVWRVLEVTSKEADHSVLVCSEGYYYARYAAYKIKTGGPEK